MAPFDDLKSLIENTDIWWNELDKRLINKERSIGSCKSSLAGSLKDFIDDTIQDDMLTNPLMLTHMNHLGYLQFQSGHAGFLNTFLQQQRQQQYGDIDKNEDYKLDDENDDDDEDERYIDDTIEEDYTDLIGFQDLNKNVNVNDNKNVENGNSKKRSLDLSNDNIINVPPAKKQKITEYFSSSSAT